MPGRLEGEVGAAIGDVAHRLDRIDRRSIDEMRGAEMARFGFLLGPHIDGDDRQCIAELRALHDAQAHAAAAEHRDAVAGPHLRRVERRTNARHGAAAEEAGLFRRCLVGSMRIAPLCGTTVYSQKDETRLR